jgi:2-dehydropantoate 2-reductase
MGWIAPKYENLSLLARGESLKVIRSRGLKSYLKGERSTAAAFSVKAVQSLAEIVSPEIIVITVKNYDLEPLAHVLRTQLGDNEPVVVALQNGVQNQQVLPKYFSRVVYGVVCYNAWRDGPGEVGHDPRGYVILGTPANNLQDEVQTVGRIFGLGLDCVTTNHLQDAVHCKLVINLANALMTLGDFQRRPIKSFSHLLRMTMRLYWEGIQLLQAAGFHEHPLGRIPSWRSIRMGAMLPTFITSASFKRAAKSWSLNSMAQDVFGGKDSTELETLNGYMLDLARRTAFPTPINEAIYKIAKEYFGPGFQPFSEDELWDMIRVKL